MIGNFPLTRMRRNRLNQTTRRLVAENKLSIDDLIWPIFIVDGQNIETEVASMPGAKRVSVDRLGAYIEPAAKLDIPALALFPVTSKEKRDPTGTESYNPDNLICRAAKELKKQFPEMLLIGDVALDPYTSHGHDGIIKDGYVVNDETVEVLIKQSINQANAGIDIIAPSDMMDGRIGSIRQGLDQSGFIDTQLMSYAAKYASVYYGPFRDALESGGLLKGDKKTYQMDPANRGEALAEVELDIKEGADSIIIKPGMPYLDIIRSVRDKFDIPIVSYQVSGEYAMLMGAIQNGFLQKEGTILETLLCFKRAGANAIMTYFALEAARLLKE
ncbi:Delta-aminolevulinic acid dehydratase [Commensalibacter communis]|uniref:Delta-aminolevulinic acid dehydratase n=1 Tax=Commensalibacter communis TaxID=2972786 RepID=A0A9W4TND1_9PROT|nr:porphobilinogen synthase [Commensalibacter communis]CAI3928556.1 Delta-aminolevulinic acid dehydratase [Commensalibacter communis]CAI3929144.1 Delta-aminolevulinic acid dehydratase [Commensalibacter communis]CAI3932320.1 Delta-aminolevulinic acid dehydratase [Commensalibacter communis]CAI3933846.1 Delta-aminolevulinic acid dehydratase [Commensalibacter communis]